MKYLLVLAVLVVAFWVWRHNRAAEMAERQTRPPRRPQPQPAGPSPMVTCRHCGLHLPQSEAVPGAVGLYCSSGHKKLAEG